MSGGRPSVLTLIAADSLRESVFPTLKQLYQYLQAPEFLQDRLAFGTEGLLEALFLHYRDASFAEAVYSLRRVRSTSDGEDARPHILSSWLFLMIRPVLEKKMEETYRQWKEEITLQEGLDASSSSSGPESRNKSSFDEWQKWLKVKYVKVFPTVFALVSLARIGLFISYVLGRSRAHSPSLYCLGLTLKNQEETTSSSILKWAQRAALVWQILSNVSSTLRSTHTSRFPLNFNPPPPTPSSGSVSRNKLSKGICPLCKKPWRNPTVATVSGVVYCYNCLHVYIQQEKQECPVSGKPMTITSMVRLYVDDPAALVGRQTCSLSQNMLPLLWPSAHQLLTRSGNLIGQQVPSSQDLSTSASQQRLFTPEFSKKRTDEYLKGPRIPRRGIYPQPVTLEDSIRYMKSKAYQKTYGDKPVWVPYRRNHKGPFPKRKTRHSCIGALGYFLSGNPCPLCRDDYLVLDYRNLDLLKQFLDPFSGEVLDYTRTHVCQRRQRILEVEMEKAKDRGWIVVDLPARNYDDWYREAESKYQETG
ncbi:unnamed protein product [Cyprideis torosa]|uniref:Small ribosomal subunit protein mS40 n=1 Tax=Cyprideis torosa TaxID=163714 RepID=A0A7R8W3L1_9CRUS|nr:unnamed protein product [Cyprideis torosa]CAG0882268.1 unnamed protein product [Cyprideis torosa]